MTKRSWLIIVLLIIITGAFGVSAYSVGYEFGKHESQNVVVTYKNAENPSDVTADFSIFWQAWEKLRERDFDSANVDDQTLIYGAIEGLTNAYGDPNTNFFNPEDTKKFTEDISGNFGGIGAEIGVRDKQLIVVAPLKDTPAEKAGLMAGDKILEIDGESSEGLSVDAAVKKIRGDIGTKVTLTVYRDDWETTKKIDITRANIVVPVVEWEMKDNKIAYIQIFSFSATTEQAFVKAATEATLQGAKGIVLDLRNDPGGLLETAVDIAGWFMPKGMTVVSEKYSTGEQDVFTSNGNASLKGLPVAVLINEGSASASEILAGALKQNMGATLVGKHSYGKGTVQQLETLKDGSTLKITIAHWLLPDGTQIEKNGIDPDIDVDLTEDDVKGGNDPQLDKALKVVQDKLK